MEIVIRSETGDALAVETVKPGYVNLKTGSEAQVTVSSNELMIAIRAVERAQKV